jgi:predicted amidohydrolase YtcJ
MDIPASCLLATLLAVSAGSESAAPALPADLVLTGGVVITHDPARPRASAIAVRAGRVVRVGEPADVEPLVGPGTRRIDLAGRVAVPGLTDAHIHVESLGLSRETLSLVGAATLREAVARVAEASRALPAGEWLLGRGWDQNDWPEKQFPTAADLAPAGDRPVYLTRVDGHAGWANAEALRRAGITAATPDPPGGRLMKDAQGRPTGVLIDAAQALVQGRIPAPTKEARKRRLKLGLQAAAEAGLTSVHDAGVELDTVPLYKELLAEGPLPVRVYVMLRGPEQFLSAGPMLRPEIGLGDGQLTVRSIKVMSDGALGSRGAWLLSPYSDEPGTKGLRTVDPGQLDLLLQRALAQGFQVNTHAIGDAANRFVLDAYARAFGAGKSGAERRFRIEHAQVVSPEDVPRFKALGVIPSMQPTHCTSDMPWAVARLGRERARGAYLWKTFREQGVPLPFGSDAPVEDIAVLPGIYAAVTRQDAQGAPEGGFFPAERVSAEDALRLFSEDAAFAAFEEGERGRLAPGFRADLTVLSRDVTRVPAREILDTRVELTVVGGRVVYTAPSGAGAGEVR